MLDAPLLVQLAALGLVWGGLYAMIGSGLNLIFGVMKTLNIAHGDFMMLGAYLSVIAFTTWGVSPLLACGVIGALAFGAGLLLHATLLAGLKQRATSHRMFEQMSLITFFALLLIAQNGALLAWSADYRSIDHLSTPVSLFGASLAVNRLVVLAAAVTFCGALQIFLTRTMVGRALRAVSQEGDVALLMGINTRAVEAVGFAIGVSLAAMGGALLPMIYVITPTIGVMFTVKAFVVVILGGLGSPLGTLVAGFSMGLFEALVSVFTGERYKDIASYFLLIGYVLATSPTTARMLRRA